MSAAKAIATLKKSVSAYLGTNTASATLPGLAARLGQCKLQPKLKAGMTQAEANAAMDNAFERFAQCLKRKVGP